MNPTTCPQHPDTAEIDEATSTSTTFTAANPPQAVAPGPRWAPTTATGRKIRSDSKLEQLNPAQRARLRYWLEEEHYSYREASRLVQKEFGVYVGKSAICDFWRRHILPDHFDTEIDAALAFAAVNSAAFGATHFDTATLRQAKALVWSEISSPLPRLDTIAQLLDITRRVEHQVITHQRLALEERRVALREKLASSPPSHPRASAPRDRSPTPPSPRPTPPPTPNLVPAAPADLTATPAQSTSTSAPPVPASCAPAPTLTSSAPVPAPPTPEPSLTSEASAHAISQELPRNPPLYPGYSELVPPPVPATSDTPLPSPPAAPEIMADAHHPPPAPPRPQCDCKTPPTSAPSLHSTPAATPTSRPAPAPAATSLSAATSAPSASPKPAAAPWAPTAQQSPRPQAQPMPQQAGFNLAYANTARSGDRHRYPAI